MKSIGQKLEIILNSSVVEEMGDDAMIMALERVLTLSREGYTNGADIGWSWDHTIRYDTEERREDALPDLIRACNAMRDALTHDEVEAAMKLINKALKRAGEEE